MKIILAGGGSGGPVSPLLAVAEEIRKSHPHTKFLFVGTKKGPEVRMVAEIGMEFVSIPASKLRRYFSLRNLIEPIVFLVGLIRAFVIIGRFKPDVVLGAGSFVSVPVAWAAKLRGVKIVIHQQDARIGLANKLIAPFANRITTAFEQTAKDFYSGSGLNPEKLVARAEWVGNPVRRELGKKSDFAKSFFKLHNNLPILLVLGGATGARQINDMLEAILPDLTKAHQVVHQTGKGKNKIEFKDPNYHPVELMSYGVYSSILQMAHLVVARAGLSTIAELSSLGKTAIIIPMPRTHQEDNAKILDERHAAAVLMRGTATAENLAKVINSIKFNPKRAETLSQNIAMVMPKNAAEKLAKIIVKLHE